MNWSFEKDISPHVWGSATFNYSCLSRLTGILHPQNPLSKKPCTGTQMVYGAKAGF